MNNARKEYTITWFIENYSYCWHKNGEKLVSPKFTTDDFEGTVWTLQLYPRGLNYSRKGYISLYLNRSNDGPEELALEYELSFLATDGSSLHSQEAENTFGRQKGYGFYTFIKLDEVLLFRTAVYLPQDTLTVRCRMWQNEGNIQKVGKYFARTRIGIENISFIHKVENFSALLLNEKKSCQIQSHSETGCILTNSLYFTDDSHGEGTLMVEIKPSNSDYILCKQKISVLHVSGKTVECGEIDNRFDVTRRDNQKLILHLTRSMILNRKSEYLPNDELSLLCECSFSTGVDLETIEKTLHVSPMAALQQSYKDAHYNVGYNIAEKLAACTSALEDMKAIYDNQCLTDVKLKTKTKSFSAHKIVLCARSSVFKAIFTNDMKEKNTDCIQIEDLEDDIVLQLLLFLYSDNLENLQWESAMKLYYAADKYAILKLKVLCSSFLFDNLSVNTASEVLQLADTHNDCDLKNFVEDFILQHEEEVFGSEEWENLIEKNPQLVIKTMHLKYKKKKEGK